MLPKIALDIIGAQPRLGDNPYVLAGRGAGRINGLNTNRPSARHAPRGGSGAPASIIRLYSCAPSRKTFLDYSPAPYGIHPAPGTTSRKRWALVQPERLRGDFHAIACLIAVISSTSRVAGQPSPWLLGPYRRNLWFNDILK